MPRISPNRTAVYAYRLACMPLFAAVFLLPTWLFGQTCGCSNCPQDIPDETTTNFLIQVNNATNPTLGQNGQGVCGVVLNFQHDYLSDLRITLTNPAGQSVTLVGPTGFYEPTSFSSWDVTFLPCSVPAEPDAGFSIKWANDQPWGAFGTFTGSYHPYAGCLETLNNGPVNGTWTLTVTDVQEDDLGFFVDYQIIFCDPTGIDCFNCLADAGNLLQPDLSVCADADTLTHLGLPPTYLIGSTPPPAPQYAYRYVLSGTSGTILAYLDTLNLSQYPPGDYSLCGLSLPSSQISKLSPPNNSLTVQQLTALLNSSSPP
ncbi:MAG TPA: proprotein convertase P-domain-containing protein, partial [Saprospiraceae bacterium]|nr:proprotein convertase P-domain-containing protein [Saprospiraceae bacterium]